MSQAALYKAFGKAIAVRRNSLRMTQAALAAKVGMSRASIANIESGRQNVLLHSVYSLAAALELPKISALLPADPTLIYAEDIKMRITESDDVTPHEAALVGNAITAALNVRTRAKART